MPGRNRPCAHRENAAEDAEAVLLVGHMPHLGALLGHLVAGGRVEIPMKKASVARVALENRGRGVLRALLPAGVLEDLGRAGIR